MKQKNKKSRSFLSNFENNNLYAGYHFIPLSPTSSSGWQEKLSRQSHLCVGLSSAREHDSNTAEFRQIPPSSSFLCFLDNIRHIPLLIIKDYSYTHSKTNNRSMRFTLFSLSSTIYYTPISSTVFPRITIFDQSRLV